MSIAARAAVSFPDSPPASYTWLAGEPPFDPDRHLALEPPTEVVTLSDLGYRDAEIEPTGNPGRGLGPVPGAERRGGRGHAAHRPDPARPRDTGRQPYRERRS